MAYKGAMLLARRRAACITDALRADGKRQRVRAELAKTTPEEVMDRMAVVPSRKAGCTGGVCSESGRD